jgi:hypothetical protein
LKNKAKGIFFFFHIIPAGKFGRKVKIFFLLALGKVFFLLKNVKQSLELIPGPIYQDCFNDTYVNLKTLLRVNI